MQVSTYLLILTDRRETPLKVLFYKIVSYIITSTCVYGKIRGVQLNQSVYQKYGPNLQKIATEIKQLI